MNDKRHLRKPKNLKNQVDKSYIGNIVILQIVQYTLHRVKKRSWKCSKIPSFIRVPRRDIVISISIVLLYGLVGKKPIYIVFWRKSIPVPNKRLTRQLLFCYEKRHYKGKGLVALKNQQLCTCVYNKCILKSTCIKKM